MNRTKFSLGASPEDLVAWFNQLLSHVAQIGVGTYQLTHCLFLQLERLGFFSPTAGQQLWRMARWLARESVHDRGVIRQAFREALMSLAFASQEHEVPGFLPNIKQTVLLGGLESSLPTIKMIHDADMYFGCVDLSLERQETRLGAIIEHLCAQVTYYKEQALRWTEANLFLDTHFQEAWVILEVAHKHAPGWESAWLGIDRNGESSLFYSAGNHGGETIGPPHLGLNPGAIFDLCRHVVGLSGTVNRAIRHVLEVGFPQHRSLFRERLMYVPVALWREPDSVASLSKIAGVLHLEDERYVELPFCSLGSVSLLGLEWEEGRKGAGRPTPDRRAEMTRRDSI